MRRYSVPQGDWFEFVSSPHYLAEIIIYSGVGVFMCADNTSWWFVLAFVIANLGGYGSLGLKFSAWWA